MTLSAIAQVHFGAERPDGLEPEQAGGERCTATNISAAERRARLISGVIGAALGATILAVMLAVGAGRLWRLALLPVWWGAANGYFQWRDKT
jgi:hypothetical protein